MAEKTYDVLDVEGNTELAVAAFSNQLPDKNVGRNSDNYKRLRTLAMVKTDLDAHMDACYRDALPDKAGEARIGEHGDTFGVPRNGATPASAENAGQIRGTATSTWATTDALVHKSGLRFRPADDGEVGGTGAELVGIVAIDTGPKTRLQAGEMLRWEETPPGLEDEVALVVNLDDGGEESEQIGPFRTRILERTAESSEGGTLSDWRQWTLSVDSGVAGIATAHPYPDRNGRLSVDVAALRVGSGAARILDAGDRAALLAYLNTRRPTGAAARVLEVATVAQAVEITVEPETGDPLLGPDWDDVEPPEVDTWDSASRTLTFTADRPVGMRVGHRIVIRGTSGIELVIEALSGDDAVVLADAKGETPTAGDTVYAGGPLITPSRDAVLAHFDTLGPRTGLYGTGWVSTLRKSQLFETVQVIEGVLDSNVVTPSSDVEPTAESTWPDSTTVNLLVAGAVLIRYA